MQELCSILMLTYNRLAMTRHTLRGLSASAGYPHELLIWDNGSDDGTREWLSEFAGVARFDAAGLARLRIVLHTANSGLAPALNRLLQLARGRYLAKVDNDVVCPADWLAGCVQALEAWEDLGVVGVCFQENFRLRVTHRRGRVAVCCKPVSNLNGACVVWRREMHRRLGRFCEDYDTYSHWDADWCERIRAAGYWQAYLPPPKGVHLGNHDAAEYVEMKAGYRSRNRGVWREQRRRYQSEPDACVIR